jgi:hypothetical protein
VGSDDGALDVDAQVTARVVVGEKGVELGQQAHRPSSLTQRGRVRERLVGVVGVSPTATGRPAVLEVRAGEVHLKMPGLAAPRQGELLLS